MGRGPHTDEETRSRPLGLRKRSPVSTVLRYLAPTPTTTPGTTVSQLQFRDESHLRVKVPPWTGPDLETFGPPGYRVGPRTLLGDIPSTTGEDPRLGTGRVF